jgi:cell division protein FtsL
MSDTTARQHSPARPPAVTGADSEATRPRGRPDPAAVHLRVVTPPGLSPARRRRRVRLLGVVLCTFVVGVVFALVGLHVMLAQNQFRLDKLNTRAAAEQAAYERSRLQMDQLAAPDRIVKTAESKLGMVPASSVTPLMPSPLPTGATTAATGAAAHRTPSTTAVAGDHPPTDWTTVKPLLVPNP